MKVILPDGKELELADDATGLDAARAIGPKLAEQAVLVRSNGSVQDLRLPLTDGAELQILTTRDRQDPDALYVLRHSTAHLLAEAARRLYPGTKVAIGPPIENGFYYDFEFPEPIGDDALERLEEEIRREIAEGRIWERSETTREDAKRLFEEAGEPYKVELVDTAEGDISLYKQGDFLDLCRGPHLQNAEPIKAVKLTSLAGAYWRGDEKNAQLTRVYGTAFFDQKDLDEYLERLEEAKRRDHRRLGKDLDLFDFSEMAPGMAFWQPRGMEIWNVLEDLRRSENRKRGYHEVRTPQLYDSDLWRTSGHWEKYAEHMFRLQIEDRDFGLKPMNCPGHCLLFSLRPHSYRDLPLRLAEAGNLHRNELSGVLHGLLRVRHFVQDDAHVYCTTEQIHDELLACLDYGYWLYDLFGLDIRVELSLRPDNKLGTDEEWDFAEEALRKALAARGLEYTESSGEGSFYGPKIDLHMSRLARPLLAARHGAARPPDAEALRPHVPGRGQPGAHAGDDPPRAPRLARALHRRLPRAHGRRAPRVARARAGPCRPGRRGPSRLRRGAGRRAGRARRAGGARRAARDARQADPRGRAGEDPVRPRGRRARVARLAGGAPATRRADDGEPRRPCGRDPRCC